MARYKKGDIVKAKVDCSGYAFTVYESKNGNPYYCCVLEFPATDGGDSVRLYASVDFTKARLLGLPSLYEK